MGASPSIRNPSAVRQFGSACPWVLQPRTPDLSAPARGDKISGRSAERSREAVSDTIWEKLREESRQKAESEPILASYLHATVLNHRRLEDALSFHLASKLSTANLPAMAVRECMNEAFESKEIQEAIRKDLEAVLRRDPASRGISEPFLHYKGFHALECYRVSHWLWENGRHTLACYLQNRISEVFAVDIHPAAKIGKGILIDHATS